ncbi:MAG: hypothetical protein H6Q86_874 [candidate division NC10 bacterium]|nr:hypothetical protein [candidate division NC10 bacterium]
MTRDRMKQRTGRPLALLLVVLALSACATTLLPGQPYHGSDWAGYLDVRSPNSEGWRMVQVSPQSIAFGRKGTQPDESLAAWVMRGPLPPTQTREDMVSHLRTEMEGGLDRGRLTLLKSEYAFTDERRYPCVRSIMVLEDRQAQVSVSRRETLVRRDIGLTCRHPVRQDTGFNISYSHRGHGDYPNLESEAQAFFDGIQVPGP